MVIHYAGIQLCRYALVRQPGVLVRGGQGLAREDRIGAVEAPDRVDQNRRNRQPQARRREYYA
jgi:hypothetical protein